MTKILTFSVTVVALHYLCVAELASGDFAILTRPKEEPAVEWHAFVLESLAAGNTVMMHKSPDGTLLRAILFVRVDGIEIITARKEAAGWSRALAKAGVARIINFEEIKAELFAEEARPNE